MNCELKVIIIMLYNSKFSLIQIPFPSVISNQWGFTVLVKYA
jgi:hypothetical protein